MSVILQVSAVEGCPLIKRGSTVSCYTRGQSEVKWSRRNFGVGQAVINGGSLETVKGSPGNRWAWLMPDNIVKRQGQIFSAVKGSSTILTVVVSGSMGDYVVS